MVLAATLLRHGVRQLVTCNRGDFEAFRAELMAFLAGKGIALR